MELEDFKEVWAQFDKKLSENTKLNMELLKHNKLNSSKSELQRPFYFAIQEVIICIIAIIYLTTKSIQYIEELKFSIPGFIAVFISFVYLLFSIMIVSKFLRIDYIGTPVIKLRKDILKLDIRVKKTRKYMYMLMPLVIISIVPIVYKSIFNINIYNDIKRFVLEVLIMIVFAIFGAVLINKYFIDRKLNNANRMLEELDKFEQEE